MGAVKEKGSWCKQQQNETRYHSEHHFRDCLCTKLVWQTTKCSGTTIQWWDI